MYFTTVQRSAYLALVPFIGTLLPGAKAQGQVIVSNDAVKTQIETSGDSRFDISGGQISEDRVNLFHSFDQFDVAAEQTANFVTGSAVQNVISRIDSNTASIIDGTLQVSGSDANLYLMNPAGVLIGPEAQLNLSGGFTATTATSIGFEAERQFKTTVQEPTNYQALVGDPQTFHFENSQGGAVVNLAELDVKPGQAITLIGGTVVNTGELTAPEGSITLAAVEGESLVRISKSNQILSLEVETTAPRQAATSTAASIGELLTGSGFDHATTLVTHADGTVSLNHHGAAGATTISESGGHTATTGTLSTQGGLGGSINVLGRQVELSDATLDSSGEQGGGLIRVGGGYQGQERVFNAEQTEVNVGSVLLANANRQGNGGNIVVWANEQTQFAGDVIARGGSLGGNGGFSEVSGKQRLDYRGNADLSATNGEIGTLLLDPMNWVITDGAAPLSNATTSYLSSSAIENSDDVNLSLIASNSFEIEALSGDGILKAPLGRSLSFSAQTGHFSMENTGNSIWAPGGTIEISGAGIDVGHIRTDRLNGSAGTIRLTSSLGIEAAAISSNNYDTDISTGNGGDIIVEANGGNLAIDGKVRSWSYTSGTTNTADNRSGAGGNISLFATGDINIGDAISSVSYADAARANTGGEVSLVTDTGSIIASTINTESFSGRSDAGAGGDIVLSASNGTIQTRRLAAFSSANNQAGNGGTLRLTAGTIETESIATRSTSTSGRTGNAGNIFLTADTRTLADGSIVEGSLLVGGSIDARSRGRGNDANIFLVGDRIDLLGGDNSVMAAAVEIKASTLSRAIYIGQPTLGDLDSPPPEEAALNIWESTLAAIGSAETRLTIGESNSTGAVGLFSRAAPTPISIQGGSHLFSTVANNSIYVTAPGTGYVEGSLTKFANIDRFGSSSVPVTVSYAAFAGSSIDVTLNSFTNLISLTGLSEGKSTLRGLNQNNNWEINQINGGQVNDIDFYNFDTLVGGSQRDDFAITSNGLSTGIINGGKGRNSLFVEGGDTLWRIAGRNQGQVEQTGNMLAAFREFSTIGSTGLTGTEQQVVFENSSAWIEDSVEAGASDLTLVGDDINIGNSKRQNGRIEGRGSLAIRPATATTNIQLGGTNRSEANTLNLTSGELDAIAPGFVEIVIGDETVTGSIGLDAGVSFADRVVLRSQGNIESTNLTGDNWSGIFSESDITLESTAGDIQIGAIKTTSGNVNLTSAGSIEIEFVEVDGTNDSREEGQILIDAQEDFVATGVAPSGASIATASTNDTAVRIRYGNPRRLANSFTIGQQTNNGTAGNIETGKGQPLSANEYTESYALLGNVELTNRGIFQAIAPRSPVTLPKNPLFLPVTSPEIAPPPTASIQPISPQNIAATTATELDMATMPTLSSTTSIDIVSEVFSQIEIGVSDRFSKHLGLSHDSDRPPVTLSGIQNTLQSVEQATGVTPALVYVYFVPGSGNEETVVSESNHNSSSQEDRTPHPNDQLEIMLITQEDEAVLQQRWGVTREQIEHQSKQLQQSVTSQFSTAQQYLPPAQQLYDWLMRPLEKTLQARGVESIGFVMDTGLRTLPIAALHDKEQHLVESYSLGLLPTFSLTNFEHVAAGERTDFRNAQVLAMGASEFDYQPNLPAVRAEIDLITTELWEGDAFLNEDFNLENLQTQLQQKEYGVLHLATHAAFEPGNFENSYIQMWDDQLSLSEVADLNLSDTEIGLIILSACSTALGDEASEYGFAGFAVSAGSQSALASLWPVSDEGTLGFMSQFYSQLKETSTRAETLQQAQISMIRGEVGIADGTVYGPNNEALTRLPELEESGQWDFSHPSYWSPFTMIGNPW